MQARYNTNAYLQLIRQISRLHASSDISLRPSQLGYGLGSSSLDGIGELLKYAERANIMTWIEGLNPNELRYAIDIAESHKTKFLGVELPAFEVAVGTAYKKLKKLKLPLKISTYEYENKGRQPGVEDMKAGRLRRSANTVEKSLDQRWFNSLCRIASSYVLRLSSSDDKLAYRILRREKMAKGRLNLEVLFGYSQKRVRKLVKDNINVSIYIPYGRDWVPYAISRLTEGHIRDIAVAILDGEQRKEKQA
ncbi:MAG: hypothetical protein QXR58_01130 [Candidatus Micrarchaeaceae archaeon]